MSEQHKGLVEAPKAEMELKKGGQWHQYQYTTKNPQAIIEDFKENFKIVPKRGHLMIVENRGVLTPYITKSGYSAIANANGIRTKLDIYKMNKNQVFMKSTAILPSGVSHEAIGYSDLNEPGRDRLNKCISMATNRARNKAIAMAMEIQTTGFEDFSKSDEMVKRAVDIHDLDIEVLGKCPKCKDKGWSKIQKKCLQCGITYDQIAEASQ